MADRSYLSIGQVLDLLKREFPDLTISKIRFLESQGLLDPERTPSGYRKFYGADIERLRFILREQQQHYLPLKVIKGRLGMDPDAEPVLHDGPDADVEDDPPFEPEASGAEPDHLAVPLRAAPPSRPGPVPLDVVVPASARRVQPEAAPWERPDSVTLDELAEDAGLTPAEVTELERFGLITGRRMGGTTYYDSDCIEIVALAAAFRAFGVQARHLRMYRTAVEREAGFFEQVVTPMLKQRNPQARRQAVETLTELSRLGHAMRAAVMRQALREYTGGT